MYLYSLSVAKTASDSDRRFCLGLHLAIVGWLTLSPAFIVAQGPAGKNERHELVTNSVGMRFAHIPAGKFLIGSPATEKFRQPDETQTEVTLPKGFYMGVYEVTQRDLEKVTGNNPSTGVPVESKGDDQLPAHDLGFAAAERFCEQLSALEAERKAGRSYRLPTEAEWEYACRAGTTTAYYFGDSDADLDKHAWTSANSEGKLHPVGQKLANPWGLYDMYGNVQEMCSGKHYDYSKSNTPDAKGSNRSASTPDYFKLPGRTYADGKPVARGGAYIGNKIFSKGAYRSAKRTQLTLAKRPDLGFRVVMELKSDTASKP